MSPFDALDGSSTGTEVPWMWVLLRPPRSGGARYESGHDNRSPPRRAPALMRLGGSNNPSRWGAQMLPRLAFPCMTATLSERRPRSLAPPGIAMRRRAIFVGDRPTGAKHTHVPYRGTAQAVNDLVAGN